MNEEVLKRIERALKQAKYWRIRLEDLKSEFGAISSASDPEKIVVMGGGGNAIEADAATVADLERKLHIIDRVGELLSPEQRKWVQLKYEMELTWRAICREMHLDRSTAWRWRFKILPFYAKGFGWEEELNRENTARSGARNHGRRDKREPRAIRA